MWRLGILAVPFIVGKLQVGQYSQSVQGQGTGERDEERYGGMERGGRDEERCGGTGRGGRDGERCGGMRLAPG